MEFGVLYLLTGIQHAARLVVSIYSLRQWYDGPITVMTTRPASHRIGALCASDAVLRVDHRVLSEFVSIDLQIPDRNTSYLTKIDALRESPFHSTLFLDADTLLVGEISELLRSAGESPLTVTEFCHWSTNNAPVREKIEAWRTLTSRADSRMDLERLIDETIDSATPAINLGVLAVQKDAKIIDDWRELAYLGREQIIPDEIALQLLLSAYPHRRLSTHYNCSPHEIPDDPDVRIWHFIGQTHLGVEAGRAKWLPVYRECNSRRIAEIDTWSRVQARSTRPPGTVVGVFTGRA